MKITLMDNINNLGVDVKNLKDVKAILTQAYLDVFYKLAAQAYGTTLPSDTLTDCVYQPVMPEHFILAFLEACTRIKTRNPKESIRFLDLGCGMGNNLFLAKQIVKRFEDACKAVVCGVELEARFVRAAEGFCGMTYGDMLNAPFEDFNVIHFFNSLTRDHAKEQRLYDDLAKRTSFGTIILLTSSNSLNSKYFTREKNQEYSGATDLWIRNRAPFYDNNKKRKSCQSN